MNLSNVEIIDIFNHILPPKYRKELDKRAKPNMFQEHNPHFPALSDLDDRFSFMDRWEGLKQVLTVALPALENVVDARNAVHLASLANDEMAELVVKHPDRFVAAVASLPMNDMDAALREADRAIRELKFKGVQIFTPTEGKPLDSPEFMDLYDMMSQHDLPIWIHPTRDLAVPDYSVEDSSKYRLAMSIGWPYETTAGMARLVYSGVLEKYPNVKFITHHCGAMVPFFIPRLRSPRSEGLSKQPEEYFKMFYVDTAIGGHIPGILCGYAFYGADHVLLGTDMPYVGAEGHARILDAMEILDIPDASKEKIISGNARRLLHL